MHTLKLTLECAIRTNALLVMYSSYLCRYSGQVRCVRLVVPLNMIIQENPGHLSLHSLCCD
jgi:hypothetical protein